MQPLRRRAAAIFKWGRKRMLTIIGIETIAALAALIAFEVICVKEKWDAVQSERRWRRRMEKRIKNGKDN
jgi:hypothetical protein